MSSGSAHTGDSGVSSLSGSGESNSLKSNTTSSSRSKSSSNSGGSSSDDGGGEAVSENAVHGGSSSFETAECSTAWTCICDEDEGLGSSVIKLNPDGQNAITSNGGRKMINIDNIIASSSGSQSYSSHGSSHHEGTSHSGSHHTSNNSDDG